EGGGGGGAGVHWDEQSPRRGGGLREKEGLHGGRAIHRHWTHGLVVQSTDDLLPVGPVVVTESARRGEDEHQHFAWIASVEHLQRLAAQVKSAKVGNLDAGRGLQCWRRK